MSQSPMRRTFVLALSILAAGVFPVSADAYLEKSEEKRFGEPTETEALVYFIRPSGLGPAIAFWAFADQTFLGLTRGRSYTFARVPAGKHLFWSKAENITTTEMEVLGGQTYYFLHEVRMGALRARVRLIPMSETEAMKAIEECKYVVPTAEGRQKGEEIAREKWDKARQTEPD